MKNFTLENILTACKGRYIGDGAALAQEVSFVTTDSRSAGPGCLFAAIAGERVDGHDYAASAFAKGALCAIVERLPENVGGNCILVKSTVSALQDAAEFYRRQFDIPVLGITGSVGKTTAKELCSRVLAQRFNTHKTAGNFNNDLGVPLTVFGLGPEHDAAVIELGVSHFGDMERIARVARPTMALFTNIGSSHLEHLGSREGILREKTSMEDFLPPEGVVFYNGDDDLLSAKKWRHSAVSFGLGEHNDVRASNIACTPEGGTSCDILAGDKRIHLDIPAFGHHMVYAALEGTAVGLAMGLTGEEIARGAASYETVGHRARLVRTPRLTLIDDCYNANPASMASGLKSLAAMDGFKVAILGDMFELGENSPQLHRQVGRTAAELGIDMLISCGSLSRDMDGGHPYSKHFDSKAELICCLPELIPQGANVLVKASHSMGFEEISAELEKLE